ncbi:uncharacterized protein LOC141556280 isoform X1 [Sminthopsis crassicaudata]|uniref:uncharacterized protein LOC141556280 isoform X1 n=1 Tax=Sminthopsis crassicaudata TaxID=9301 RepID=UPI003D694594
MGGPVLPLIFGKERGRGRQQKTHPPPQTEAPALHNDSGRAPSPGRREETAQAGITPAREAKRRVIDGERPEGLEGPLRPQSRRPGFPQSVARPLPLSQHHRGRFPSISAEEANRMNCSAGFWARERGLPIKLQQEAKSKSQSPSLQTTRHPISWERELQQYDKPCIFIPEPRGNFQIAWAPVAGKPGTESLVQKTPMYPI